MAWTEDRVEALSRLWQEGHSASQIAAVLGGVTRNAVIGKVHRLGISERNAPSKPKRPPRLTRKSELAAEAARAKADAPAAARPAPEPAAEPSTASAPARRMAAEAITAKKQPDAGEHLPAPAPRPTKKPTDIEIARALRASEDLMRALEPKPLEDGSTASVLTVRDSMCRWPIGDPADDDFALCGRPAVGGPYCAAHARIAFQPPRKKEERKIQPDYVKRIA